MQQRVFCTRSEPGSQNVEIFVYGGTKDVCRCHSNGLEELCTGCYQDTRRVDWFSWHGRYLDSLKEARGRVAWLQQAGFEMHRGRGLVIRGHRTRGLTIKRQTGLGLV